MAKLITTTIDFAGHRIEALFDPDSDPNNLQFFIGVSQVASQFSLLSQNATREVKAALGKDSQLLKRSSDLHPSKVNVLTLAQFEKVLFEFVLKGNEGAITLARDLAGQALVQICADAFGVKFEKTERQLWAKARYQGKLARRRFTDRLRDYGVSQDVLPSYGKATLDIYRLAGIPYHRAKDFRDSLSEDQLREVEFVENLLARSLANGMDYRAAINHVKISL